MGNLSEQCVLLGRTNRGGTSVDNVGSSGYYWSASYSDSSYAYDVYFTGSGFYTGNYYRYYGRSVRLVRVAEN